MSDTPDFFQFEYGHTLPSEIDAYKVVEVGVWRTCDAPGCNNRYIPWKDSWVVCNECIKDYRTIRRCKGHWTVPLHGNEIKSIYAAWRKGWLDGPENSKKRAFLWSMLKETKDMSKTRAKYIAIAACAEIFRRDHFGQEPATSITLETYDSVRGTKYAHKARCQEARLERAARGRT